MQVRVLEIPTAATAAAVHLHECVRRQLLKGKTDISQFFQLSFLSLKLTFLSLKLTFLRRVVAACTTRSTGRRVCAVCVLQGGVVPYGTHPSLYGTPCVYRVCLTGRGCPHCARTHPVLHMYTVRAPPGGVSACFISNLVSICLMIFIFFEWGVGERAGGAARHAAVAGTVATVIGRYL